MGIFYKPEKKKKGGFYKSIAGGTGNNLDNSLGLYSLAKQSGLQKEADRIVQGQKGETEQIFSGGVITDLFDTLNALQYGTGIFGGIRGYYNAKGKYISIFRLYDHMSRFVNSLRILGESI